MNEMFSVRGLEVGRLLQDWGWLCKEEVTLVARNGFGDLFLRCATGEIKWLDVGEGTLSRVADSEPQFWEALHAPTQRELWFAESEIRACRDRGLTPNETQCIGFRVPLIFSESKHFQDNAYVADLYEYVSFLGDLHRKLDDTPDDAKIELKPRHEDL